MRAIRSRAGWTVRTSLGLGAWIGASGLMMAGPTPAAGQAAGQGRVVVHGATQSAPVAPDVFTGDVRDLVPVRKWMPGEPVVERPRRAYPRRGGSSRPAPPDTLFDPLMDLGPSPGGNEATRTLSVPELNFGGSPFTGVTPPDTVGDVGPDHYIQAVNDGSGSRIRIFDKSGTLLAGPFVLETLVVGGACASGLGDPVVLYDPLADRWLLSEFASVGNHLCVYISQTADPVMGGWVRYDFPTPNFPDYPKYAVWPTAYFVSTNESTPAVYALDRAKMLSGLAATSVRFNGPPDLAAFPFQALTPADFDGLHLPPAGAPGIFMRHRDDEAHNPGTNDPTQDFLELFEFQPDFTTPANSTFTGPIIIPVASFDSDVCGFVSINCFPQPGTATTLDPVREVIMWRLQYRSFGTHQTLVGNFTVDVNGADHGGIRWFELRKTGGPWTLFQQGTVSPDADHRWMGSIGMDEVGNIALGYNISSAAVFPSIGYTGRGAGDALGTMPGPEMTLIFGSASQSNSVRWGDYSALTVDPADDCTFWYTSEYLPVANQWSTQIGTFRFSSCSPNLITNGGIEADANADGLADGWTLVTNDGQDRRKCNTLVKAFGHTGRCAHRLSGDAAPAADTLKQIVAVSGAAGDSLVLNLFVDGKNLGASDADVILKVKNTVTAEQEKVTLDVPAGTSPYAELTISHMVGSVNALLTTYDQVKVVVKILGPAGARILVDDVRLKRFGP